MKTAVAQRVVVMGREGQARDQLVAALSELGVTPVWVGKPVQSNPEQMSELNANRVIVSLEPSIEPELEPYADYLSRPAITVLYDDAETTRALSGWDLKRWARHMAAKVLGRDMLPQAPRGPDPEPAKPDGAGAADDAGAFDAMPAWSQPLAPLDGVDAAPALQTHSAWQDTGHYDELAIDSDELNAALEKLSQSLSAGFNPDEILELSFEQKPPGEGDPEAGHVSPVPADRAFSTELEFGFDGFNSALDLVPMDVDGLTDDAPERDVRLLDGFTLQEADGISEATQAHEGPEVSAEPEGVLAFQSDADYAALFSSLTDQTAEIPSYDLSKFALADDNNAGTHDALRPGEEHDPALDRKTLFLVISGLGGPVAVRTLLGQLNPGFQGILAIAHDIEPGQLPKLRDQFQKITAVPITVPESDEFLKTGNIYLLPRKHTLQSTSLGYQCIPGASLAGYIDQMDHNAEILILSGADALLAQQLIQVSAVVNNIHVQQPADCFEPTLAQILVNVGAPVIDQDVTAQWFN